MKRFVNILCCVGAVLFLLAAALCYHNAAKVSAGVKHETVYDTIPWFDTIPYYLPVPRDSVVIRYVTATLPAAHDSITADDAPEDAVCEKVASDSARVVVPITQKVYCTPDFTAYVSGYQASLDSFNIYRQHYQLEPRPPDKTSRWGLSAGTGVAWTPDGLRPALFVGVTYTFKRF